VGCITKLQTRNSVHLIAVFTNTSQHPLFNFAVEFVARDDLQVRLLLNAKNCLEISGQTKCEVVVTVNQLDFRCLLASVRFTSEGETAKIALLMPISKLKLAQQLPFTPPKKQPNMHTIQRVLQTDKKMLPNLHKLK
jgi:hypothetical protein